MKTITYLSLAVVLTLRLAGSSVCCSQTVAIGHASAEVVEAVSAASQAITSFTLGTSTARDILASGQTSQASATLDLGAITINSGKDISCNIVVKPASLSDSHGNGFTLAPTIHNNTLASVAQSNGSQTIQLDGTANPALSQASGLYRGSYTVVIAFN